MSKGGILKKLGDALRGVGIKAPWAVRGALASLGKLRSPMGLRNKLLCVSLQYTGPVSSPEYLSHLPKSTEYRKIAPG
jgi:hypothetical protein